MCAMYGRDLTTEKAERRQTGLAGLVLFKHSLLPLPGHGIAAATVQIAKLDEFWQLLQRALVFFFCAWPAHCP